MDQEKDNFVSGQVQPLDQNTTDSKSRSKSSSRKSSLDFRKYTKQIWLAGLGAFSRAEEEGNKLFDSLVKVGEELESTSQQVNDQTSDQATHRAQDQSQENAAEKGRVKAKTKDSVADKKDKVEKIIDQGVNHSLNRIGLVTAKDLQYLESLILQLHQKVDVLTTENAEIKAKLTKNGQS
ncbi:poly(hydroxyalkanoate) granule-associated protein [Acinetobacter calcoaceticus]|uniref:Poly(Hydroxyalkanoate) granule-associated protein n=1 Tax=Acinetobacter calcoaceticus TaxID=471 RepID=A0A4R1Y0B3_ACICA|nr:poly(hydroxyalkanoate) granule-associated protein [Acinetobacter calcoaceticus]